LGPFTVIAYKKCSFVIDQHTIFIITFTIGLKLISP
jgi:hypothetical protein